MARILVIDDEPDVLMLCRVNLSHIGHEVVEAGDAATGLAEARSALPDVIVLDLMMPRLDGFQLMEVLAADESLRSVPIVILSAKAAREDRLRSWGCGASAFITKPFAPAELAAVIERVHAMTPEERRAERARAVEEAREP